MKTEQRKSSFTLAREPLTRPVASAAHGHAGRRRLRCCGIALLFALAAATGRAHEAGAVRLALSTQKDNATARRLYEKAGWALDEQYCTYNLRLAS